jgi:hypothetical protein
MRDARCQNVVAPNRSRRQNLCPVPCALCPVLCALCSVLWALRSFLVQFGPVVGLESIDYQLHILGAVSSGNQKRIGRIDDHDVIKANHSD